MLNTGRSMDEGADAAENRMLNVGRNVDAAGRASETQALNLGRGVDAAGRAAETQAINTGRSVDAAGRTAGTTMLNVGQNAAGRADAAGNAVINTGRGNAADARAAEDRAINIGRGVDAAGRAAMTNVGNTGSSYSGRVATSYGTSQGAGTGAISGTNSTTATGTAARGAAAPFINSGTSAIGNAGNMMSNQHRGQMDVYNAQQNQSSGIGSALGIAAGLATSAIPGSSLIGRGISAMFEDGGAVPIGSSPSAGRRPDDVNAALTAGEFVIPKDVASWYGEQHLQKLIEKARHAKAGAAAKPSVGPRPPGPTTFNSRQQALPLR